MPLDTSIMERTDSYKLSHHELFPYGAEFIHSYCESRGGQFPTVIAHGTSYIAQEYMCGEQVTKRGIERAAELTGRTFPGPNKFNYGMWEHIRTVHKGRLPLRIRAVPEGMEVPVSNVLWTVENTGGPITVPLAQHVESLLLKSWYPTTVATLSHEIKKVLLEFLVKTGTPANVNYMFQDFGYRGVSSEESAQIGGAANLLNFHGTDTLIGVRHLEQYYGARPEDLSNLSIPASEHSTITSWGREHEGDAIENLIDKNPGTPVASVSDSFDIFNACEQIYGERLRDKILRRVFPVIVRPDSGDPKTVLLKCLEILGYKFGIEINAKGFKVLCPKIRLIQGDGVNYWSIIDILTHVTGAGWSADNLAFGMGGALLQQVNRDTQKFAVKTSSMTVNGVPRDVRKDPITDKGKQSKGGVLALITDSDGLFRTIRREELHYPWVDLLETIYEDGEMRKLPSFLKMRSRAASSLQEMLLAA